MVLTTAAKYDGHVKAILMVLAAAALLLGACGQSSSAQDVLVGTWTDSAFPNNTLVITRQGDYYLAASHEPNKPDLRLVFSRNGDRLTARELPKGFLIKPIVQLDTASGHLYYSPLGVARS